MRAGEGVLWVPCGFPVSHFTPLLRPPQHASPHISRHTLFPVERLHYLFTCSNLFCVCVFRLAQVDF